MLQQVICIFVSVVDNLPLLVNAIISCKINVQLLVVKRFDA